MSNLNWVFAQFLIKHGARLDASQLEPFLPCSIVFTYQVGQFVDSLENESRFLCRLRPRQAGASFEDQTMNGRQRI